MFRWLKSLVNRDGFRRSRPARPHRIRPGLEALEDRWAPAILPVTSTGLPASMIHNAEGLAGLDFFGESRTAGVPGIATPIGIAPVLNMHDTFLVTLIGVDPNAPATQVNSLGTIHNAIFDLPDPYRTAALQAIHNLVPSGSTLILTGHSLGGIEAQNLVPDVLALGYHVSTVITFGSPLTAPGVAGVSYVRFMAKGDLITSLSPLGIALGLVGHPEQIQFRATGVDYSKPQPPAPTNLSTLLAELPHLFTEVLAAHLSYPRDLALTGFDAMGHPGHRTVLEVGQFIRV
jgi:hypothetical protein